MGDVDERRFNVDGSDGACTKTSKMCWAECSVKIIGDEPKYVALAPLGESFFFARARFQSQTPVVLPFTLYAGCALQASFQDQVERARQIGRYD
jgi:hypothetical protein